MKYKCDNCAHQLIDPIDGSGEYRCTKKHWNGPGDEEPEKDPWRFCKDYEANV